jgi:hypothetical protein
MFCPAICPQRLSSLMIESSNRLLSAVLDEQKRRRKQVSGHDEKSGKRRIQVAPISLTRGQFNAVRAAFKAGVTPSRIARQFGLSQSDVRKALAPAAHAPRRVRWSLAIAGLRRGRAPPPPQRPKLNAQQLGAGIERLQTRIREVEQLEPDNLELYAPKSMRSKLQSTIPYLAYSVTTLWSTIATARRLISPPKIPSFGESRLIGQYQLDVQKGRTRALTMLRQAVQSLNEELAEHDTTDTSPRSHGDRQCRRQ